MNEAGRSKYNQGRWERNAVLGVLAFLSLPVHLCGDSLSFTGTLATPEDTFTQTFSIGAGQTSISRPGDLVEAPTRRRR